MRRSRLCLLLLVFSEPLSQAVSAAPISPAATVAAIPAEISEVVSGGAWTDGAASGSLRTVTMQVQGESEWAQVFLQWIGSRSPVEPVQLLVSLPVAEFNALKLPSASVTIDTGTDGGTRIEITGQESEIGPPTTVTLIASTPGHYRIMPLTASKGEHTDRQR